MGVSVDTLDLHNSRYLTIYRLDGVVGLLRVIYTIVDI